MTQRIEFELEAGGSVIFEVADEGRPPRIEEGMMPATGILDVTEKARQSFEAAIDRVKPAAEVIVQKLRSLAKEPDELELEFGLKMDAEAGAIFASVGVEANFKVTMTWKKESESKKETESQK